MPSSVSVKSHRSSTSSWRTRPKFFWLFPLAQMLAGFHTCWNCLCQNRLYSPSEIPSYSCLTHTRSVHYTRKCNSWVCDYQPSPGGTRISRRRLWNHVRLMERDHSQTIWDLFTKMEKVLLCEKKIEILFEADVSAVLDFLTCLFREGLGYSAINSTQCSFSSGTNKKQHDRVRS